MSVKASRFRSLFHAYKGYLLWIVFCMLVISLLFKLQAYPAVVEKYYSQGFYPYFSYLPKLLFAWIPFSIGDICYALLVGYLLYLTFKFLLSLFRLNWDGAVKRFLQILLSGLSIYLFFQLSWGLNYYRVPLQQQLGLQVDSLKKTDFLLLLDKYIARCNHIRPSLMAEGFDRSSAKKELQALMLADRQFGQALSKTMVKAKSPLNSHLVSCFTVTGYFNPFTQEVQVNEDIPIISYPFTVVHELTHQMGIGFEDECNFVAFLKLKDHTNPWYRYAASYETVQYLLRTLNYQDPQLYKEYQAKLSPLVRADMKKEREFWSSYSGWMNTLTDFLYQGYLQHNNQPEGIERYSMMSRLVLAWELKESKDGQILPAQVD